MKGRVTLLLAIGTAGLALSSVAAVASRSSWVGAYGNAPIGYEPTIRDALGAPLQDQTVRQIIRIGMASDAVRIRLSNELGPAPLRIGAATFAQVDPSGNAIPTTIRPLTFNGRPDAVIAAGAPLLADVLATKVTPGVDYAISIYYPEVSMPPAHAQMADVAPGDQTGMLSLNGGLRKRVPALVSRIDVAAQPTARTLLAFGDSITEGAASTPGAYMSWPDQLARLLAGERSGRCWSVLNAGISGNRLLHDGRGPGALARFDRDVLSVPGVRTVLLLEGINDIGASAQPEHREQAVSTDEIIGAYREIIARAHAHGIRVLGGTLLPFEGAVYFSADGEAKRQAVNAWIRSAGAFDGVIDFDMAMRDAGHASRMSPAADSKDNLHPRDAGYAIMARIVASALARDACPGA